MRILFHHRIRSKDGQYVHLSELVHAFRKNGHEVLLVGPEVIETESFGAGAGYVDLLRKWLPRWLTELLEFCYSFAAYPRLARAIRSFRPDFIYERYNLLFPVGVIAAARHGIPIASEINAPLFEERRDQAGVSLQRLARWSQKCVWQRADLLLPVTQVLADIVVEQGGASDRVLVMPNGVDTERFDRVDAEKAKSDIGMQGRLVLGFVGFVREWHGVDRVVRLLATDRMPGNTHLLIVGDGPARAGLEELARSLGVDERVSFTGVIGRDEVMRWLGTFDVALQPAVTSYASPLKIIEYMAMGKAIVAPGQPNIRELLTHGANGWLFAADDPAGMPEALCLLANDSNLRQRLGHEAFAAIAKRDLTWDGNARRIVDRMRQIQSEQLNGAGAGAQRA